jgi:phytoene dehydrogenase-like protein
LTALRQRPYQVQLTPDAPTSESIRTRYAVSPSRAPAGRHTAWAYCHVPNGSEKDCTELIERQIARFAPNLVGDFLGAPWISGSLSMVH